jgi:hypothetical protein
MDARRGFGVIRSSGEIFTILGFQLAMTIATIAWISTSMHCDVDRIHSDMAKMRSKFQKEWER